MKAIVTDTIGFAFILGAFVAVWFATPSYAGNCQDSRGYYYKCY